MLSVNLGLINLFPIPILDGGHLLFYLAEAMRGRPLPPRALEYGFRAGFALLAGLFVFATWNDLAHLGLFRWVAGSDRLSALAATVAAGAVPARGSGCPASAAASGQPPRASPGSGRLAVACGVLGGLRFCSRTRAALLATACLLPAVPGMQASAQRRPRRPPARRPGGGRGRRRRSIGHQGRGQPADRGGHRSAPTCWCSRATRSIPTASTAA